MTLKAVGLNPSYSRIFSGIFSLYNSPFCLTARYVDYIINHVSTSVVKFCLRGTPVYIEVNVKIACFWTSELVGPVITYAYRSTLRGK